MQGDAGVQPKPKPTPMERFKRVHVVDGNWVQHSWNVLRSSGFVFVLHEL